MALGALVLADLAIRAPDHLTFLSDQGIFPLELRSCWPHSTFPSLYLVSGSPLWAALLFGLTGLSAVALLVGYQTRWATLATWYLVSSMQIRNVYLADGSDVVIKLMLFWGLLLPLGARASVDARRSPQWDRLPNEFSSPGSLAYLLQLALIYFMAALHKRDPVWRESGEALAYVLNLSFLARPGPAELALQFPQLLRLATFAALGMEFLIPLLILSPWASRRCRAVALGMVICLHGGIAVLLNVGMFPPTCIGAALGLLPGPLLDWLEAKLSRAPWAWRTLLGKLDRRLPPTRSREYPPSYRPSLALVALPLAFVIWINLLNSTREMPVLPEPVTQVAMLTQLNQRWDLFAPRPNTLDSWFIMEATTAEGQKIDLLRGGTAAAESYAHPRNNSSLLPNLRWRSYLENAANGEMPPPARLCLLRWAAQEWNAAHPQEHVSSVKLLARVESILPLDEPRTTNTVVVAEFRLGEPIELVR
jgi:hypothetical protein